MKPLPIVLAAVLTAANAVKPVLVDDTAYLFFARHIAERPDAPYGFRILWNEQEEEAMLVLAPPVLPYYLGTVIRLLGESPLVCKLALFPFALLFTSSLFALCNRVAPPLASALTVMTTLSPVVLPSLNLMLDVPAYAFLLASLAIFLRALERGSTAIAAAAGVLAAIGMETKYTAMIALPIFWAAGLVWTRFHRTRGPFLLAAAACLSAAALFAGCEALIAASDPLQRSHFLTHVAAASTDPWPKAMLEKLKLTTGLVGHLGALSPALLVLAMTRSGRGGWGQYSAAGAVALGYTALVVLPERWITWYVDVNGLLRLKLASVLFTLFFAATAIAVVASAARLTRSKLDHRADAVDHWLVLWLVAEIVGYYLLTPFPAARRTLGIYVAASLLVGRSLFKIPSHRPVEGGRTFAVGFGVALGAFFWFVDIQEANVEPRAVQRARSILGDQPGRRWYVGHWGFQYYADRNGWSAVDPNRSTLVAGDWLVFPDPSFWRPDAQDIVLDPAAVGAPVAVWEETVLLPVQTLPNYYSSNLSLTHNEELRGRYYIYRIHKDWTPMAPSRPKTEGAPPPRG